MNNLLIERLQYYKSERTKIRKKLFREMRANKHLIKDGWLLRKMELNYLGDLDDDRLIMYMRRIEKAKGKEDAIH
jgi:hypothetical protein